MPGGFSLNATLRVGLIGSGGMAAARAERFAAHPACTLVALAGRNAATVHALASRWGVAALAGWRELVGRTDVDAVCIATHPDTHAAMAQAALAHGKHVFVETPLALDLADADAIVAAAQSRGRVVRVGLTS
ncbi:MAG: Gfo/Idh/MocA family oxidoreductase, partial [Actinobacteria bacterium]|nr:Gfo/Idh/MocA family oxidoreductase [Actinomycetota bacterium]